MSNANKFETITTIEENIVLIKTNDEVVPFNLKVDVSKKEDMVCDPPDPYFIPSNEKGKEGLEIARRIKLGIFKKVYPDSWEIKHIEPEDRFAKKMELSENSAGYHYVNFKSPNKTKKYPSFEARVYNPETRRMTVIATYYFGQAYSGESLETAFYKACIAVDKYYGNTEKSFRTYQKHYDKSKINKSTYEECLEKEKNKAQYTQRVSYLRKYLVSDNNPKATPTKRTNLFMKHSEDEFYTLKGHYPYIYINEKEGKWTLSAVVPEFEEHRNCTLGTFIVDQKTYKPIWKQLAKLVDGHFKRQISNNGHYEKLAPTFNQLTQQ